MKVHYIGRQTYENGKKLMSILGRLKGYGVGRMVYRQHLKQNYPEPSYHIITKVDPNMADPGGKSEDKSTYTKVYAQTVFRGEEMGERILYAHWKEDWRLVPKAEEHLWKSKDFTPRPVKKIPEYMRFPPLFEYRLKQNLHHSAPLPLLKTIIKERSGTKKLENRAVIDRQETKKGKKRKTSGVEVESTELEQV